MNQEKIGKFICECRKDIRLTQQELADKLGITDKAVSKWENGRCMPDISLIKDLTEILGISINELLIGEKINDNNYKEISELNLIALLNDIKDIKDKRNKMLFIIFAILLIITGFLFNIGQIFFSIIGLCLIIIWTIIFIIFYKK